MQLQKYFFCIILFTKNTQINFFVQLISKQQSETLNRQDFINKKANYLDQFVNQQQQYQKQLYKIIRQVMRSSNSKNQFHVFNKFLRKYKASLQINNDRQQISNSLVLKIFQYLGYIDQYKTQQSQQLCHSISYMLSENKEELITTKASLFQFLRIISDIKSFPTNQFYREVKLLVRDKKQFQTNLKPLIAFQFGLFNQNGDWKCSSQEQIEIKRIFGSMNLKRISRQNIEAENNDKQNILHETVQQQTFQPQILDKSRNMAQKHYKKLSISLNKNSRVEDRLLVNQSLNKSRLQEQINKSMQKQMKQCYFNPKINSNQKNQMASLCKYIDSMNTSFENKQNDKSFSNVQSTHQISSQKSISKSRASLVGGKLLQKGKQYENHIEKLKDEYQQLNDFFEMKECTFQPKLYKKVYNNNHLNQHIPKNQRPLKQKQEQNITKENLDQSLVKSNTLKIRNVQKSIQRVKQARKKRQFQNQCKQRGYPQNIVWTKFINQYKSKNQTSINSSNENKIPILCIDLKILSTTKKVQVYEDQSLKDITEKICIQNDVPHEHWQKVSKILKNSIQQCDEVKIDTKSNKIYLKKQGFQQKEKLKIKRQTPSNKGGIN